MPVAPTHIGPVLALSLVAWGIYRRIRRNIGPQELQPKRMTLRIVIFSAVSVLLVVLALPHPSTLIGFGVGLLLGVPLALVGLHLTRFETTAKGRFYTPNMYIGMGLSLLLVGRMAYRYFVLSSVIQSYNPQAPPAFMQSRLTLFMFGLTASYYIAYYIGLLVRSRVTATLPANQP